MNQRSEIKKFVVRFWHHWRPLVEGFHFHWKGFKNSCLQFKTFRRVIYIPLDVYLNPSSESIISLEGYLNPSSGNLKILDVYLNPSSESIIFLEGYLNPSSGNFKILEGYLNPSSGNFKILEGYLNSSCGMWITSCVKF